MNEDLKLKPGPIYIVVRTIYILIFLAVIACGIAGMLGVGVEKEEESAAACSSAAVISYEEAETDGIDCL